MSGTGPGSPRLAARTVQLADATGVPAVLTNAVRYADPDQHKVADVLDAARLLRPIRFRHPAYLDPDERWLKDPGAMAAIAARIADASGAGPDRARELLANTARTADECRLDPVRDLGLGTAHFPEPALVGAEAATAARVLRERCEAGMARRGLDRDEAAQRRLARESEVIARLGFDTYFLTVGLVVADVREMGIRVAARGSGAGSMVCHALDIATANPLDHDLLFERFMSERRSSLPDIDIDVESARRSDVYRRIFERFGSERVAVTSMPETYRARHALRDVGLALGLAAPDVDRIAKSFPHIRTGEITAALADLPELRPLAAEAARFGPLFELAERLDALPRGMAMHPCGVIITDGTLSDRLPVQPTPRRRLPDGPGREGGRRSPRPDQARRAGGTDAVRDGARRRRDRTRHRRTRRPRRRLPGAPGRLLRVPDDPGIRHHRHVPTREPRPTRPAGSPATARSPGRHRRHLPVPARTRLVSALTVSRAGRVPYLRGGAARVVGLRMDLVSREVAGRIHPQE
ncbi:DNA polymerase III alpha subunit [Embleya sp. AB8]